MIIKTLIEVSVEELLEAFNAAFEDYFIPLQLSVEQLAFKLQVDEVALEYSVGVFDKDKLVGFILHGIAEHQGKLTAYNAGTGVIKAYRGQQLTSQLYEYILPLLQSIGLQYSILEVIQENKAALQVYQQIGFQILRGLNCYQQQKAIPDTAPARVQQRTGENLWVLPHYLTDTTPTWQMAFHSIQHYKEQLLQFIVVEQGQLLASLMVYQKTGRILQLYVEPTHRRKGLGSLLLGRAASFVTGLSIINVEETRTDLNAFLNHLGFEKTLKQYEMGLVL